MTEPFVKLRGQHRLNIFVSYQLKERIMILAKKYDRTMSDMIRTLIKVGIPVMEAQSEAADRILKESVSFAGKLRKVKQMKIEEDSYQGDQLKGEA